MRRTTVINPADRGRSSRRSTCATPSETDAAIARAHGGLRGLARPGARRPRAAAAPLRRRSSTPHIEELAQLEVANSGHTIGNARWEAGNVRDVPDYYSGAPERLFGQQIPVADGIDVTFHEPLGVVGVIVPWNFPMPIAGWGFAPALAAGNTVVLKPAELTPLTAIRLGELALEAGLPAGRVPGAPGQGHRRRQALRRRTRDVAQDRLHRLDRGRPADHGRLRRAGQAGDARARRQERQRRLRRRRPRAAAAAARRTRCSTTPARTAAPARGSSSSAAVYDGFLELLEPAVRGVRGHRPGRRGQPRWGR